MQLIYESPGSRFMQHYCSLYLRKYLRRTQKLGHCNVFIMQEYLAEFQFCKVILHLLSDAGASNDVFWIHYKLTTDMVKELYQTLSSRPQFWIFNYFWTKCIFRVQSVFFNYYEKICRLCERYSCRKPDKKCLLFQLASFLIVFGQDSSLV